MTQDVRYRQFKLQSDGIEMVCWLKHAPILTVGRQITLKDSDDPTRLWTIVERYAPLIDSPPEQYARSWKVGGLS